MIEILRRANELRFSEEIQNLYTEVDDTNWFVMFQHLLFYN